MSSSGRRLERLVLDFLVGESGKGPRRWDAILRRLVQALDDQKTKDLLNIYMLQHACSFLAKESQAKHENYIQNKHAPHRG